MAIAQAMRRYAAFDSLQNRDFRWFWLGRLASSATMEMGSVAQGWLAYQLTGSALALGWVGAGRSVARLILSLYAGAIADRFEKRNVLLLTRGLMIVNPVVISILIVTGTIRVWHLALYSFVSGVISSFMMPAQKAYLAQLVERDNMMNAVSLTSVGMGLVGIFGATAAGFLIDGAGIQTVYFCIAGLYLMALFTLTRLPKTGIDDHNGSSVWADLRGGLGYLKICPIILPLLAIAALRSTLGWSYRSLMPVYAQDVLGFDASGLGLISAAPSVGSLLGSFGLASLGNFRGKGKLLIGSGLVMGIALLFYANVPYFALVLVFLVIAGAARNGMMVGNQTLIQVNCEDEYRGRVMSMYMMTMGLMPIGTIGLGALADAMGVQFAITVAGGLLAIIFAALWLGRSRVKALP